MSCGLDSMWVRYKPESEESEDASKRRRVTNGENGALPQSNDGRGCCNAHAAVVGGRRGPGTEPGNGRWTRAWPRRRHGRFREAWDGGHTTRGSGRKGKSCTQRGAPSALAAP